MKETDAAQKVKNIYPDELEKFMGERKEGEYTLLDVRQGVEYEEEHLPGARLVPLPELADSLGRLDPTKTTVVYCAVGGRSKMAAHVLAHHGFDDIYHLMGGILGWEKMTAKGPVEFHLKFVRGDESPEEIISVAYSMEDGLKKFHEAMRTRTDDPALSELLKHLVNAEIRHEEALLDLLASLSGGKGKITPPPVPLEERVIEGGVNIEGFIEENRDFLQSVQGYLELAMMIETQALDLYLRIAAESGNETTKKALLRIADEEKAHLRMLGTYIEAAPR